MRKLTTAILLFLCVVSYGQFGVLVGNFQKAEIPTDSLVFFYPYTGNVSDSSGNSHNLTNNGAVLAPDRFDNANSSYYFDGTDNMNATIDTISNRSTKKISVSIWAKADTGTADDIMRLFQVDLNEFTAYKNTIDQRLEFIYLNSGSAITNAFITDSLWHHVVLVYDGSRLKAYYDNNEVLDVAKTPGDVGGAFYVGSLTNGNQPWKGYLDDIRGYEKALTPSEIEALYHENGWTGP